MPYISYILSIAIISKFPKNPSDWWRNIAKSTYPRSYILSLFVSIAPSSFLAAFPKFPFLRKTSWYDSRPSMKDLNKHVIPLVATRWYDLGLELLETKHERELDIIEKDSKTEGVNTCCRKMFSKWLESQFDSASWDRIS